jgi:UDP:flavonoid glycosyltransferase YjiC (YdhE family)
VEDLGVGVMVRRAADVADAVARVCDDPAYRVRARALADAMSAESGERALVDAVEAVL